MDIKGARLQAGLRVTEVAKAMKVTEAWVYQWEAGDTKPRIEKLVELADLFGVTVDELLKGA